MMSYDVIVIGAGVVGSAVARELSRYQLKTAVLEKELAETVAAIPACSTPDLLISQEA